MMNNLSQIADFLKENNNYVILPHKNPDGDCLGSTTALLKALWSMGKNAKIILPSQVNERLSFVWDDSFSEGDFETDAVVCVDVASIQMMGDTYEKVFKTAPISVCIDHHGTNEGYAQLNYVDSSSAAAGEIIFELIGLMGAQIDSDIAERLLVAIADDTGCFQYSNTTSRTHEIASHLYKRDIDSQGIMNRLYSFHKKSEIEILKKMLANMEFHYDGKVCVTHIDYESVSALGGDFSQSDAWIGLLRSVENVEVGILFKIHSVSEVKVSLRSNKYVDVSEVAKAFGGGGHVRASGVTFFEHWEKAKSKLIEKLKEMV